MTRRTTRSSEGIQSPLLACYFAAHDYQGGVPALAVMLDKKPETLRKKLDPNQDTHQLSLAEAMHLLRITRDSRILDAICAEVDVIWLDQHDIPHSPADMDVLKSGTELISMAAQVLTEFEKALEDGQIDNLESAKLSERFMKLSQAQQKLALLSKKFEV